MLDNIPMLGKGTLKPEQGRLPRFATDRSTKVGWLAASRIGKQESHSLAWLTVYRPAQIVDAVYKDELRRRSRTRKRAVVHVENIHHCCGRSSTLLSFSDIHFCGLGSIRSAFSSRYFDEGLRKRINISRISNLK